MMSKVTGYNILRPEVVESIFMLYRTTNDTLYRDMGWSIFQAFETYSKVSPTPLSSILSIMLNPEGVLIKVGHELSWPAQSGSKNRARALQSSVGMM